MTFPPPHPASHNSIAPGTNEASIAGPTRVPQSPWGAPGQAAGSRRGLTPLSTNLSSSLDLTTRRQGTSNSPSFNTTSASPFPSTFSAVVNNSNRAANSRNAYSASSSTSLFTPLQTGSQQLHTGGQLLLSPRSRDNTPSSNSFLPSSAAASTTASQAGGGGSSGGGGGSRSATFSPSLSQQSLSSPTSTSFDRSALAASTTTSASSSQSSVSKIVVAQVFLLLGSITEKEGKGKWESQAEGIRKLIESNGMEVFAKYFRRLLVGNSPQIFPGINRNVENPANYPMLVQEMEKITRDPSQAQKIAETIDTSEGDIFRDFDLSTFMSHFKLDPLAKTLLSSAFIGTSKPDLRTKAGQIMSENRSPLIQKLGNAYNNDFDVAPSLLAMSAFRFLQDLPEASRKGDEKDQIYYALKLRYSKQNSPVPPAVRSVMSLIDLLEAGHEFAKELQRKGPSITANIDLVKEMILDRIDIIDEEQIGGALLFMILTPDWEQYHPDMFVTAIRQVAKKNIDWHRVVKGFDRSGVAVSQDQFLELFEALLPVTKNAPDFDVQSLWGGRWSNTLTQLSFVLAFASLPPSRLDATNIPGLRKAWDPSECVDDLEGAAQYADEAKKDTMISIDAVTAILDIVWDDQNPNSQETIHAAKEVVGAKMGFFLCSAAGLPKPWTTSQLSVMAKVLPPFLLKQRPDYKFVLRSLWKQDKHWLATRLIETHLEDPIKLPMLLDHAQEHGWLEDLCTMMNGFGIDLAAYAHRKGLIDLDQWAQDKLTRGPGEFVGAVSKFLVIKAQDEMRTVRDEQPAPRTVSLSVKTVFAMLELLEEQAKDRMEELIPLERQCMQAFPRLINYGEGFDHIIEANGEETNALSEATDAQMQELYKRMYSADLEVRDVIESLRAYKNSEEPAKQDLFACMIHGLFDEYVCFNEYPLGPLATTAVLFGGIISYSLISRITLHVGLEMVLEAVRDYDPETSMYKFGLQALLHFLNRLREWPEFCQQLIQIPGLEGTDAYNTAMDCLPEGTNHPGHITDSNGVNGLSDGLGLTNGNIDEFLSPDVNLQNFKSISADPISSGSSFEDPDEEVQDKVLFVLNNVTEQNINAKFTDLIDVLEAKHFRWLASYLVEERAKLQDNYQLLYLEVLNMLDDKILWGEVLRETYASAQKALNADSTMHSASERKYLGNIATWLGLITIARDKPIKHKNVAFKDLLIEGYEMQKLLIVVPFVCDVLMQATRSLVFKPPNPWFMEILLLLLELYDTSETKLNQKFKIEILCSTYGLSHKKMKRSTELQTRQQLLEENLAGPIMSEGNDGFEDMALGNVNHNIRNAKFSQADIASSLPDLEPLLVFPPSSGNMVNQSRLRQIVQNAVHRAIIEIIAPVVERSVTIATIATSNLIHKDFAREPDEDRVRRSAQKMVRALSGSLALVTCKEPLRMSMTNYIRMAQAELPDQALFPEGAVLMCVNDNLDTACSIVESQAEDRSMPEIEAHIEGEIAQRQQHRLEYPSEPYRDPSFSNWSGAIPEPYKQSSGGLNQEQMEIYLQFARQSRGPVSHIQSSSMDSGRQQIPDVLQDAFGALPNLSTPAESAAVPHQVSQQQQQPSRMLPPPRSAAPSQPQINGYMDTRTIQEHIQDLLAELNRVTKAIPEKRLKDLTRDSPLADLINQIHRIVASSSPNQDAAAGFTASAVYSALYDEQRKESRMTLEVEALAQVLHRTCLVSLNTAKEVILTLRNQGDEKVLHVSVTAALLEVGLMEFGYVDVALTKIMYQRRVTAVESLSELMDILLFSEEPIALRADFSNSLGAMGLWLSQEPELTVATDLLQRLRTAGLPEGIEAGSDELSAVKKHQMQYLFLEWVSMCSHPDPSNGMFIAFLSQLHQLQILNFQEDMVLFLRMCIDSSVDALEREELENADAINDAYFSVDALAKLIILLVKNQGETDGAVKSSKSAYMKSILSLIILILNNHHVMRGEQFNQRLFFRLFSSILCDWYDIAREGGEVDKEMMLVFGDAFLLLEPRHFPAFTYGWLTLVSHRIFMPILLKLCEDEGCERFARIMEAMLSYVSELSKPQIIPTVAKELYRGVLRILLILHHDFPEFLAENHVRLCNIIPVHCTQLRNLVLSAYPSSFPELPDPFTSGLRTDRLDEIRKAPKIAGDFVEPLRRANIKTLLDESLTDVSVPDEKMTQLIEALYAEGPNISILSHSLVLYLSQAPLSAIGLKGSPSFSNKSPQASLLSKLARELQPEPRYYFLNAIANQLRYPNSHTHYFSYALLHLFGNDLADQQESDVRQQITRVLLERLIVHRPHPWGLIITLMELLKNPTYMFWELPFIKAAPEIERLFGALFQHINQSPRALL